MQHSRSLRELFVRWGLTEIKLKTGPADLTFRPNDLDQKAAWELYVELLTRITTQPLAEFAGTEEAALASVHSLFATTRDVLRRNGPGCTEFAKVAIVILNQVVRPFTAKWHPLLVNGSLNGESELRQKFRAELARLQAQLRSYSQLLADIADVEDLTALQDIP